MSEIENKKPKLSKLALISFLLAILGLCEIAVLVLSDRGNPSDILLFAALFILILLPCAGIVLGIISYNRIRKNRGVLYGRLFSIAAIIMSAILIIGFIWPAFFPPAPDSRFNCAVHQSEIAKSLILYAYDNNNTYPSPDRWGDLISQFASQYANLNLLKIFVCPGAPKRGDIKRCNYAMNPNCEPNSPPDIVLLFETKDGWNQHGGPELLTFDNHNGKGANVCFNDGHVEFIKPEDAGKLKWKADDVNNDK